MARTCVSRQMVHAIEATSTQLDLVNLPSEVLLAILCRLENPSDLGRAAATCRQLCRLCDDSAVWRTIASRVPREPRWKTAFAAALKAPVIPYGLARLLSSTTLHVQVHYQKQAYAGMHSIPSMPPLKLDQTPSRTVSIYLGQAQYAHSLLSNAAWIHNESLDHVHVWRLPDREAPTSAYLLYAPCVASFNRSCQIGWWEDTIAQALGHTVDIRLLVVALHGDIVHRGSALFVPVCVDNVHHDGALPYVATWYAPDALELRHRESCSCYI